MTTITLDEIKAEQTKLAKLIAAFETQARESIHFPEQLIELAPGEHYAGIIVGKDGEASYHLILLTGEGADLDWNAAKAWAKGIGGDLPTRREQALLYANLKEHFQGVYYWSGEQPENKAYAWYQHFNDGYQLSTNYKLQARAVRRLIIE